MRKRISLPTSFGMIAVALVARAAMPTGQPLFAQPLSAPPLSAPPQAAVSRTAISPALPAQTASPAWSSDARSTLLERDRRRARSEEYVGEVVVISKDGRERRKIWRSYRSTDSDGSNRLIRFLSPPDVRGVGYLARFRRNQVPDEWLYLPAMKRERRIGARDREGAFVNTDFSYDDLDLLEFDERLYEASWVTVPHPTARELRVALTPRTPSVYSRKVLTLQADDLHLLGIEYFVRNDDAPVKRLTPHDYHTVGRYQVASRLEMADLRRGSRTIVYLRDLAVDRPQPADRYTIQSLLREDDDAASTPGRRTSPSRQQGALEQQPNTPNNFRLPGGLTGYVEGRAFSFIGDRVERRATVWATGFLRYAGRVGRVRIASAARIEDASSPQVGPPAFDPADRDRNRSAISLRELSVTVPVASGIDVRAGRSAMAWGHSDGYSPVDAFLPRDLSDPLAEDRLPLWAVSLRGERQRLRFEVVAVPITTPWRLPELSGRYSPFAELNLQLDERPWQVPRRGFGAARIEGTLGSWDFGVWGRGGVRPAPVLVPQLAGVDLTTPSPDVVVVPLDRHFATEHAGGVSASRIVGGWTLLTETSLSHSPDPDVGRAATFALGASRIVGSGGFTATFAANAIEPPVNPLLMFDRALLPCIILAGHRTERWGSWSAAWLATFRTVGGVFGVEASRDVTDVVKMTIGADLPHGSALSPAAAFSGGERVRAGVRWSW